MDVTDCITITYEHYQDRNFVSSDPELKDQGKDLILKDYRKYSVYVRFSWLVVYTFEIDNPHLHKSCGSGK